MSSSGASPIRCRGGGPTDSRDGWERIYHLSRSRRIKVRHDAVRIPSSDNHRKDSRRAKKYLSVSTTGSGASKDMERMYRDPDTALPSNVLHVPLSNRGQRHSAAFPPEIPAFFIRAFTDPGDVVMDPFMGSGTTAVAAIDLGRRCCGAEASGEYHRLAVDTALRALRSRDDRGQDPLEDSGLHRMGRAPSGEAETTREEG